MRLTRDNYTVYYMCAFLSGVCFISIYIHACPFYKSRRSVVKSESSEHRSVVNFELWNSDYKGPFPCKSLGGNLYCILFIERGTNIRLVYFTPAKNGTSKILPTMPITDARRLHMPIGPGSKPFIIHGDNGSGEFRSEQNISAFALMNATITTCPPYTPAKNGAAERS